MSQLTTDQQELLRALDDRDLEVENIRFHLIGLHESEIDEAMDVLTKGNYIHIDNVHGVPTVGCTNKGDIENAKWSILRQLEEFKDDSPILTEIHNDVHCESNLIHRANMLAAVELMRSEDLIEDLNCEHKDSHTFGHPYYSLTIKGEELMENN